MSGRAATSGAAPARPRAAASGGIGFDLHALRLAYGRQPVLDGIDLTVRPGERVGLVGPNGAGKSSLLRCLTGLEQGSGRVMLDGRPLEELGRERLARLVAVVPQQAVLPFSIRVEEVVALGRVPYEHPFLGPGPDDREAVAAAIERVSIGGLVGRDARHLSLGERQLVLLALALAQRPRLLVLDEPTLHLDLGHQVRVMELLRELNDRDGTTVLAVLHDLALAAHFFPRVVLLDEGRLIADGPPAEVLRPERVATVYRVDPSLLARLVPGRAGP